MNVSYDHLSNNSHCVNLLDVNATWVAFKMAQAAVSTDQLTCMHFERRRA